MTLAGKYTYRSFCPRAAAAGQEPQAGASWGGPVPFEAATDASGKIAGKLTLAPGVDMIVTGAVTPAAGNLLAGVELTGEFRTSVNKLRGYFLPGGIVAGNIVAVKGDLAKLPDGTSGAFVLVPNP